MNFDFVASFYDQLGRLVFGQSIFKAQTSHFDSIGKGSKILIVGGGTGLILEQLPERCEQVTFIEPSVKMMRKALQRKCNIPVKFIHGTVQRSLPKEEYDVIITNFFFDMFDEISGLEIARRLRNLLKADGLWIVTEFEKGRNWWQLALLYTMYIFFSLTTGLQVQKLPAWREMMIKAGMQPKSINAYFGSFIASISYQGEDPAYSTI